jgi:hypothetical protein
MRTRRREKEEETEETEEEARESRRAKTRRSLRRRHHSARAERVMMIFSFWSLCDESDFSSRVVPGRSPLLRVRFPFAVLDLDLEFFSIFSGYNRAWRQNIFSSSSSVLLILSFVAHVQTNTTRQSE